MIKDILYDFAYMLRALMHLCRGGRVSYKDEHKGEICVLGNGPSLTDSLPSLINANKVFFVVNDFAISDNYKKVKPEYYVMVDPYYWEDNTQNVDIVLREMVFKNMNERTTWKMVLYVPNQVVKKKVLRNAINNPNVVIKGFNYTNFYPTYSKFYLRVLKNNIGVVPVGNVLGQAIYLSINLGYDIIKVYGAEHSWTKDLRVNDKNEVCTIKRHFYSDSDEIVLVPWKKSNGQLFRMYEILTSLKNHFLGYQYLEWYSRTLNRKIFNCTPESFIDSFERAISHKNEA